MSQNSIFFAKIISLFGLLVAAFTMETPLPAACSASPFVANMTIGPLGIDYVHIHYCMLVDLPFLSFSVFLLWLSCLFYFLGSTADGYFSPTLASLSDRLRVSHDVAGVTFLAFGNGAPDVFTAIAAYSSGVGETAVNGLLGGAMFVSTVVVGVVAVTSKVKVQRWAFLRDAGAQIAALVLFLGIAMRSSKGNPGDTAMAAVMILVMYGIYVGSVVLPACVGIFRTTDDAGQDSKVEGKTSSMISAFWHALSPRVKKIKQGNRNQHDFLTRNEAEKYPESKANEISSSNLLESKEVEISSVDDLTSLHFSSRVFDDHFDVEKEDLLSYPLIADVEQNDERILLEWQQHLRWKRRLRRRIIQIFKSDSPLAVKFLYFPQAVLVFVRDLTVPLFDNESWSRPKACLSVVTVPLLVALTSGYADINILGGEYSYRLPLWQVLLAVGGCAGAVIAFLTHRSHPPRSLTSSMLLLSMAFAACVCWIYAAANELMALLVAVGYITHASNSLIGLTVLAWGNSVGDLITDVSVARAGFSQMAIAGCFGGPVFNLSLGLGLPMMFAFLSGRSEVLSLDLHAWISLGFLFVSLVSCLIVFGHYKYHCPAWCGKALIVYYSIYSILNIFVALQVGQM